MSLSPDRRGFLKSALASVSAASLLGVPGGLAAKETEFKPDATGQTWEQAQDRSLEAEKLVIYVYGAYEQYSSAQVGEHLENEVIKQLVQLDPSLAGRNLRDMIEVYTGFEDKKGTPVIAYYLKGSGYGPNPFEETSADLHQVAGHLRGVYSHLFASAPSRSQG